MSLLAAEEVNLRHALRLAQSLERHSIDGLLYALETLLKVQGRWIEWDRLLSKIEDQSTDERSKPLPGREALWVTLLGLRSEVAHYRREFDVEQGITDS